MPAPTSVSDAFSAETLNYPEHLPVTAERQTILDALDKNQVLVVAGETGSGKTTQLPKMLLELGLHQHGMVGHTQPRRLAARSVAERLAEELETGIGRTVGYQVRFTTEVGADTAVKLMTDGILLAEIQRDPQLKKYSAIIIDEAHERSLNIDVILGYLKNLLPQRPDLKVVVTSATIDPQRFSEHFGGAPIIEVSGRTYPVEVRYRPLIDPEAEGTEQQEQRDELDAVCDAVQELAAEPDGDILIFFPGEREIRDAADALHRRFADEKSDFSALLNLWRYIGERQRELSSSQFRRLCRREHLNWLRIREWQDLVNQLGELAQQAKLSARRIRARDAVDHVGKHAQVHQSLLAGLLSNIGLYSPRTRDYQGARGTRFQIFPGSGLFKKNPELVMAAELVETSRLWARSAAGIEPAWAEELGASHVKRSYSDPTWSAKRAAVVATERVTLFGVPIVADRTVLYAKVDPEFAREEFIRRALVEGDWSTRHHFDRRNRDRLAQIEELEERTRRRDLRAADHVLVDFFSDRLPQRITDQRAFDHWWKNQRHETPELLDLPESVVMAPEAEQVDPDAFPTAFDHDGLALELTYAYEAGVTVRVPVVFLNQLVPHRFAWFIPGRRTEMITALIRSMPKQLRKNFVPAPDVAAEARRLLEAEYDPGHDDFRAGLASVLRRLRGVVVETADLDTAGLPDHLRFTFAVVSERGRILDTSFDLEQLQLQFTSLNQQAISRSVSGSAEVPQPPGPGPRRGAASPVPQQQDQTTWTFGELPRQVVSEVAGRQVTGYPALTGGKHGVSVTVTESQQAQEHTHRAGVLTLLRLVLPSPQRYVVDHLSNRERLAFGQFGQVEDLVAEATTAVLDHLVPAELPFTGEEFERVSRHARAEQIETTLKLTEVLAQVLTRNSEVRARLGRVRSQALRPAVSDMQAQIDQLVYPGFITATGYQQMRSLPRYLDAITVRLDRLEAGQGVAKDTTDMQQIQQLEDEYDAALEAVPAARALPAALAEVKWMLEELRVGLFAQQLGTAQPVSAKRVRRAIRQAA